MKKLKKVLLIVLAVVVVLCGGVMAWCMFDYYPAEPQAMAILNENPQVVKEDGMITMYPDDPGETGIVFYPGAKVQAEAYLTLFEPIREQGVTVVVMEMPFRLAIFAPNAADEAIEANPQIKHWYICGHSLGGAFASKYAVNHDAALDGAILLAANLYGGYDAEKALLIYGSLDSTAVEIAEGAIHEVVIPGGNHAQFGSYGHQKGDAVAEISDAEQKAITVDAIMSFIKR